MPQHCERADGVILGMTSDPRREKLVFDRLWDDREAFCGVMDGRHRKAASISIEGLHLSTALSVIRSTPVFTAS